MVQHDDERFGEFAPPRTEGTTESPRFDAALDDPLARPPPPPAEQPPPAPVAWSPPAAATARPTQPPPSWPPPPGVHAAATSSDHGAMGSLILGIGGLLAFVATGFGLLFIVNLPASIAAWVMGVRARRAHDRGDAVGHEDRARWGLALGVVGTVLGILAVIFWTLAIATSEEVRDELRKQFEQS